MDERDQKIIDLTLKGLCARKIKERLKLDITVRAIQRVVSKNLGHRPPNANSYDYQITGVLRDYVLFCLKRLGKDPYMCEICHEPQVKKCDIHHTKYAGSTIYDLQYVCRTCNLSFINVGRV